METSDVDFSWGARIPLRDGVHLHATVYRPRAQTAPVPCIITMTPYIADTYHERGMYFASQGFPFLIVDVRGRGNSEGTFEPNRQESSDGYDVVEWVAAQPYCDGKVAMWGGSYAGYNQWATTKELPPHLSTIAPAAAPYRGLDSPMHGNIFFAERIQWLSLTSGKAAQMRLYADDAFWSALYRRWYESGRSFRELDAMVGHSSNLFQEWLEHPEPDTYWDMQNPTSEQYARLEIPVLSITGIYDDDQLGTLEHYRNHKANASAEASNEHYLVIGPWDHAGTRTPSAEFGGIRVASAGLVDLNELHRQWYAWTMQNGPKPGFLMGRVAYYVMQAERWQYADSLDEVTRGFQKLYLDSRSNADDVFCSGTLAPERGGGLPDAYVYDPRDTGGPQIDAEERVVASSLVDQSLVLALRGKHVVYHSAPFKQDTEVSGFFKLSAWIAIDCPDTDLYASVFVISQNGGSVRLGTDAIRARYREGLRQPRLIRTRDPLRYDFEHFPFISRLVRREERLRLVLAPMGRLIQGNFAQKNYNGGGIVAAESIKDARPVRVRVFHDSEHPSALFVPLGRGEQHTGSVEMGASVYTP
jgi:uncharacterized protein